MNTTDGARNEYFDQLADLFDEYFTGFSKEEDDRIMGRILSITFDSNQALQKRVEELEAGLTGLINTTQGFCGIEAWINDRQLKESFQSKYYPAIDKAQQLLAK